MIRLIKSLWHKTYASELFAQLFVVFAAAIDYGIIEAKWIPTGSLPDLPVLHHFSYYHVCLLILMAVVSFCIGLSHIKQMLTDRKKYLLFMGIGSLPLALMIEDATWFVTRWQPILRDEWTMVWPGVGINLGFTWIPLWYLLILGFSGTMFWLSHKYSKKGRNALLNKLGVQSLS